MLTLFQQTGQEKKVEIKTNARKSSRTNLEKSQKPNNCHQKTERRIWPQCVGSLLEVVRAKKYLEL